MGTVVNISCTVKREGEMKLDFYNVNTGEWFLEMRLEETSFMFKLLTSLATKGGSNDMIMVSGIPYRLFERVVHPTEDYIQLYFEVVDKSSSDSTIRMEL